MSDQLARTSSVKLGLSITWPVFWTGVPFKIGFALLFLAFGVHPWEMPGLAFLLLLSIPVDIWACGLCARTVFLERLRLEPLAGLGFTLWWKTVVVTAAYGAVGYFIQNGVIGAAKSVAHDIMELPLLKTLPVAERIGIELTLWGAPATIVLLGLAWGWLFLVGAIVRKQARAASPAQASYQLLVRTWDLMRVPADQGLLLTTFTATGVVMVLLFWGAMPVTTPRPHEDYKDKLAAKKVMPPLKPAEELDRTDKLIAQAEKALAVLEAKKQEEEQKGKGRKESKGLATRGGVRSDEPSPTKDGSERSRAAGDKGGAMERGKSPAAPKAAKDGGGAGGHTHESETEHSH